MATQSQPQTRALPEMYQSILADPKVAARFWAKVNKNGPVPADRPDLGPCWLWTGFLTPKGYGRIGPRLAHRRAYEWEVSPIPRGLTLDHLCRVHPCVRPAHLEVVTMRVNTLRGEGLSAQRARQTHCRC